MIEDASTTTQEPEIGGPVTIENPDLLLALFNQMHKDSAFTTNALIDSYRESYLKAQAELDAVRWAIRTMLDGEYAPSHLALLRGLWPSEELINKFRHTEEGV